MSQTIEVANACWETLTPSRLAVFDHEFATRLRPWPELVAALFEPVHRTAGVAPVVRSASANQTGR
jgi:hypothetical protein